MLPEIRSSIANVPHPSRRRRAVGAIGLAVAVQLVAAVLLRHVLRAPWRDGVPVVLGFAMFASYHPDWWRARWRRATLVQLVALVTLGLAIVALDARLG